MDKRRRVEQGNDLDLDDNSGYQKYFEMDSDSEMDTEAESESYSDSESDTENIDIEALVQSFRFKLRKWAVTYNISMMALTFLLKLLRDQGHQSLPKDARTLLQTPRTVKVTEVGSGKYWYRSLIDKLTEICKTIKCPNLLELGIHCDGFPPFRSSKLEFWPIQVWIKGIKIRPFFVGLHFGPSKPSSLELFLRPLLTELQELLQNGLTIKMKGSVTKFAVKIHQMILDAPARAFFKCIVGHSGYFSCERCEEGGEYLCQPEDYTKEASQKKQKGKNKKKSGHVCLIRTDAPLRTDLSFRTQQQEEHHHGNHFYF